VPRPDHGPDTKAPDHAVGIDEKGFYHEDPNAPFEADRQLSMDPNVTRILEGDPGRIRSFLESIRNHPGRKIIAGALLAVGLFTEIGVKRADAQPSTDQWTETTPNTGSEVPQPTDIVSLDQSVPAPATFKDGAEASMDAWARDYERSATDIDIERGVDEALRLEQKYPGQSGEVRIKGKASPEGDAVKNERLATMRGNDEVANRFRERLAERGGNPDLFNVVVDDGVVEHKGIDGTVYDMTNPDEAEQAQIDIATRLGAKTYKQAERDLIKPFNRGDLNVVRRNTLKMLGFNSRSITPEQRARVEQVVGTLGDILVGQRGTEFSISVVNPESIPGNEVVTHAVATPVEAPPRSSSHHDSQKQTPRLERVTKDPVAWWRIGQQFGKLFQRKGSEPPVGPPNAPTPERDTAGFVHDPVVDVFPPVPTPPDRVGKEYLDIPKYVDPRGEKRGSSLVGGENDHVPREIPEQKIRPPYEGTPGREPIRPIDYVPKPPIGPGIEPPIRPIQPEPKPPIPREFVSRSDNNALETQRIQAMRAKRPDGSGHNVNGNDIGGTGNAGGRKRRLGRPTKGFDGARMRVSGADLSDDPKLVESLESGFAPDSSPNMRSRADQPRRKGKRGRPRGNNALFPNREDAMRDVLGGEGGEFSDWVPPVVGGGEQTVLPDDVIDEKKVA